VVGRTTARGRGRRDESERHDGRGFDQIKKRLVRERADGDLADLKASEEKKQSASCCSSITSSSLLRQFTLSLSLLPGQSSRQR
jgi:hypothetical protein